MYPFQEIYPPNDASKEGLHYMANPPQDVIAGVAELAARGDLTGEQVGSFFGRLEHALTQPARSAFNVAERAVTTPFQVAERVAMTPFALMARAANRLPSMPGSGPPGGGARAPGPQMPDPTQSPDGGGDDAMSQQDASAGTWMHPGHRHHHYGQPHHMMGFHLSDLLPDFMKKKPAGELLISAVPGGATALEARNIANKALDDGTLKPEHVTMSSRLLQLAHLGHKPSLAKIAKLKQSAGRGDPHAEVALDRLKLIEAIRSGRRGGGHTSSLRHLRNVGLATLRTRRPA
jgi:hypothetical protein